MLERLGPEASEAVAAAEEEARRLGHQHVGTEHLVLGLLSTDGSTAQLLRAAGATLDGCRSKVAELVGPPGKSGGTGALVFTERAQRVLTRADRLSLRRLRPEVEPDHILLSLLDVEGTGGQVLRGVAVDVAALRVAVSEKLDRPGRPAPAPPRTPAPDPAQSGEAEPEPRCAACGSGLDPRPLWRLVEAEDLGGRRRTVMVVSCRTCGAVFGAGPI